MQEEISTTLFHRDIDIANELKDRLERKTKPKRTILDIILGRHQSLPFILYLIYLQ